MDWSIDAVMPTDLVLLDVGATDRDAVISRMVDQLSRHGRVTDRDRFLSAVLAREADDGSGMGLRVAMPHARSAAVTRASVVFARSAEGIDFGGTDGPSTLVLLIATPEHGGNLHLQLLGWLSRRLIDEDVRRRLHAATTPEEVVSTLRT